MTAETFEIEQPRNSTASVARRILLVALAVGVIADLALRRGGDGLGFTLVVVALALAAAHIALVRGQPLNFEQRGWLGIAVACAAGFAWRDAPQLRLAHVLGFLVAIAMFAMTAAGRPAASIMVARVRDVLAAGVYTVRDLIFGMPILAAHDAEPFALPAVRGGASWTAVRALLLTVPVVLVFAVLLSRADPVFASVFALPTLDVPRIVSHVALTGAFTWWSAGWLRGALLGVSHRPAAPAQLPIRLGRTEITASLGALIVLFSVFVLLQLRWLFGGADVVLATTGLTVAEYARRGFFELVTVAALVLPLILGTGALAADAAVGRHHRQLSRILLVLLGAIMGSALLRMGLYVGYFGLTTDRLYATVLMGWLAVVFVALALTVLRDRPQAFAAVAMVSGFATVFAVDLLNPERLVARVNLTRPDATRPVDYEYLARLSGDAVPVVVRALIAAPASAEACKAAELLRLRWPDSSRTSWNLGFRRGHEAVHTDLTDTELQRLCAGVPVPASGASRL